MVEHCTGADKKYRESYFIQEGIKKMGNGNNVDKFT